MRSSFFAASSTRRRSGLKPRPARLIWKLSIDIAERNGLDLRRVLASADRLSDCATSRALGSVNTPGSRSSASLVRITRADHRAPLRREALGRMALLDSPVPIGEISRNHHRRHANVSEPWEPAAVVADMLSAQALVGLLESEGVPTRMDADTALLGVVRQCRILVPRAMIRRARYLLWETRFSDEELASLAMGETQGE